MSTVIRFGSTLLAGIIVATLAAGPASAQKRYDAEGASDTEIKIGQTMPYSGRPSSYGTIGTAMAAYFEKVNAEGGVNGRKITLLSARRRIPVEQDSRNDPHVGRAG